jgi:flagellar biosynthesis/type III secretory pathway protein FliH
LTASQVAALGLPELVQAEEKLRVISQDRNLRDLYEQRMKAQRDAIAWEKDRISAWLEQGEKAGLDKGMKLGLEKGEKAGLEKGLREAIGDMCELLGIQLTPPRRALLETLDAAALKSFRDRLKASRAWPLP